MSQYLLYVIVAAWVFVLSIGTLYALWRHRFVRGAAALIWSFIGVIGYLICNTLELVVPGPSETLVWAKISYLFLLIIPTSWLAFAMRYSGLDHWLTFRRFTWFCIIPAITFVLVQTNDVHGLIWPTISFVSIDGFLAMRVTHGQWFWVQMIYSYGTILVGIGLIFRQFMISWHKIYRLQFIWILFGAILCLVSNFIYIFQLIPGLNKNYSPISFALTTVAYTIGILQFGLFEIVPIARSIVVDKLQDGVFVVNRDGQIVDVNPAAAKIAGLTHAHLIGLTLAAALPFWQELAMEDSTELRTLSFSSETQGSRYYDVRVDELNDTRNRPLGWLVSLRDVTERQMLLQKNRELAASDWLTELYNRRHFEELGKQEIERALRFQRPLSVLMIDLDHFKQINDRWGHHVGDQVLQEYSRRLQAVIREFDLIARYGGEEMVVLLPNTDGDKAYLVAQRLWNDQQNNPIRIEKSGDILLTVSIGVYTLDPVHDSCLTDIIERADLAVYQAKAKGRNCIEIWTEHSVSQPLDF